MIHKQPRAGWNCYLQMAFSSNEVRVDDSSDMARLQRAQQCYDRRAERVAPAFRPSYRSLAEENEHLREQLVPLLLPESRDTGHFLNRRVPCAGNRLLRIRNEIESIDNNE